MERITKISLVIICLCFAGIISAQTLSKSGQKAEYDKASIILMHEPGEELFLGMMHPSAALYEEYFDIHRAAEEHANYRKLLEKNGIKVLLLKDVLLQGTLDAQGNTVAGKDLDDLRYLATKCLKYNTKGLPVDSAKSQEKYIQYVLRSATPKDLVRILLLQPTVNLEISGTNTNYSATYNENPLMNLFYMRDQVITTAKGIVVGNMNSVQREKECELVEFCLKKLDLPTIGKIEKGSGAYLEGGDFIPFGNKAFIGCGLRTTQQAIDQLMNNDWLGCDSLIVVNDHWKNQVQMHLDTYFNVIDKDLVTLIENRLDKNPDSNQHLTFDLYVRKNGTYQKVIDEGNFADYLTKELKITIIPIQIPDGNRYANNFLAIGARKIMAVDGQSDVFKNALKANNVNVTWVPIPNLIKGYGAAHCMTQVIVREREK